MSLPVTTSLLREWHRLAREESVAIALQDWNELNRTIDAKARLQELLEDYPGEDYTSEDRELVNNLIGITQQHQQLLGNEMDSLRKQIAEEDKNLSNGRKVGAAYGQRTESYWGTYSEATPSFARKIVPSRSRPLHFSSTKTACFSLLFAVLTRFIKN